MSTSTLSTARRGRFVGWFPRRQVPKPILPALDERVRAEGDSLWAQLEADRLSFARLADRIAISGVAA